MTKHPMVQILFQPTEEQAEVWPGRKACIGPMTDEEWKDLWTFLSTIDGFVGQIAGALAKIKTAGEAGQPAPEEALRQILVMAEDAAAVANLMPAVHYLMSRFALVNEATVKKGRLQ